MVFMGGAKSSHGRSHRFDPCHAHQPKRFPAPIPQAVCQKICQKITAWRWSTPGQRGSIRTHWWAGPQVGRGAAAAGVRLASLEDPIALVQFHWGDRFRDLEGERQPDVERLDDSGGHLGGGVPVAGADAAATLQLPAAAALVPHELIDDPGRDAFVF
jgi:hypothetical protein